MTSCTSSLFQPKPEVPAGNDRAARFYEKCGWHRAGNMVNYADTLEGPFPLEVWHYEKSLPRSG